MTRLLLWDVDGTLIRTRGIGAEVFDRAFERVLGLTPAGRIPLSGKTDPQIVLEYLELMVVDDPHVQLPRLLEQVEAELAASADLLAEMGSPLPGITRLLPRLAGAPGVHQTLLTGNLTANAAVKVGAFGLQRWLDLEIGAYGSDHADRCQLVPIALGRARQLRQLKVDPDDTWVIGDTANDFACAQAGGVHCLLVATGGSSAEDLRCLGADAVMDDLSDVDAAFQLLAG
ncbi:MAG: HAD hydrolase-like protein [Actinomycetota bacterium]|nr:HAD hydrolase-like protein [Actinomycetota bacterium]